MKKFLFVLICSALFGLNQMKAQNLTVHIQGIEQDKGKVFIALFNSQETWLKQSFKSLEQDVTGATCTVTFTDLPKGEYAIAIFHDENGNGTMDFGKMGIPIEKFGFSNDAKCVISPPAFEDAKIVFEKDAESTINLQKVEL